MRQAKQTRLHQTRPVGTEAERITVAAFTQAAPSGRNYVPLRVNKRDAAVMAVMTLVYLALALFNLGSFDVPQTEWSGRGTRDGFIIDLGAEKQVSRITFYSGLGKGTYHVWYQDSEGLFHKMDDLEVDDFYKWHVFEVSEPLLF